MSRYLFILFILLVSSSFAQPNLDTLKIDALLRNSFGIKVMNDSVDSRIIRAIEAIDKNINAIVIANTTWTPRKVTIIRSDFISIRQLLDKSEAIQAVLADTMLGINWSKFRQDTTKLLSAIYVKSEFDLNYPNYQYPKEVTRVDPLTIQSQLNCYNLLFYNQQLDLTIDSLSRTFTKRLRPRFYEYLNSAIDYFCLDKKRIEAKSIRILTITFGSDNIVYCGIDIYGIHYLLAFDTNNFWSLESVEELWTY